MANMYNYNTSSAYKLDYNYPDRNKENNEKKEAELKRKQQRKAMTAKQLREKRIKALIAVAAIFVMSFIVVNRYVEINEAQSKVTQLQNEYNNIVAANQDLQAKIDKAVDLKKLQTVANKKFGMVRPERFQMFYIDMQQEDKTENPAQEKGDSERNKVAVQGVPGTLISSIKLFK